ncbi:MAG: ABC transporter permease [Frankia sp.]
MTAEGTTTEGTAAEVRAGDAATEVPATRLPAGIRSGPVTVAPVRLAGGGPAHYARAVRVIWQREVLRFMGDRTRIISGLIQPFLFLFVLGTGLSKVVAHTNGVDYRTFLFPGVVAVSVLFTAIFSGISIVWDREFGFLREMLVAPVRRSAIVVGKCLGGATTASLQGVILLAIGGLVGVPYAPLLLLGMLGLMLLTSFAITALGLVLAARIKTIQAAMPLVQMALAPMMFLSGALYPIGNLPTWLQVLTRINPVTYAVEAMRALVFSYLTIDSATRATLDPGVTWGGWRVPGGLDVVLVVVLSLILLAGACLLFRKAE